MSTGLARLWCLAFWASVFTNLGGDEIEDVPVAYVLGFFTCGEIAC